MICRMRLQYNPFNYHDLTKFEPGPYRSCTNNNSPSNELGRASCISYRITVVIHVEFRNHAIDNWINEQFAVSLCRNLYTHMHGLIFDTSIWLLAGSTRFLSHNDRCIDTCSWAVSNHVQCLNLYTCIGANACILPLPTLGFVIWLHVMKWLAPLYALTKFIITANCKYPILRIILSFSRIQCDCRLSVFNRNYMYAIACFQIVKDYVWNNEHSSMHKSIGIKYAW